MHDEPRAAARARRLPRARRAHERRREAAAVDEHERLLAAREPRARCASRSGAPMPSCARASRARHERGPAAARARGSARARQRRAADSGPRCACAHGLERRRRAAEHDRARRARCARQIGDVARVIAHAVLLLVRGVVLLVDDDERERAAAARTRASRVPSTSCAVAARGRQPVRAALAGGEPAVQRRRCARRAARRARARSSCGVRLISGTSSSTWPPRAIARAAAAEVDLGLAAAGDAVQQERRERAVGAPRRRRSRRARCVARSSARRVGRAPSLARRHRGVRGAIARARSRAAERRHAPARAPAPSGCLVVARATNAREREHVVGQRRQRRRRRRSAAARSRATSVVARSSTTTPASARRARRTRTIAPRATGEPVGHPVVERDRAATGSATRAIVIVQRAANASRCARATQVVVFEILTTRRSNARPSPSFLKSATERPTLAVDNFVRKLRDAHGTLSRRPRVTRVRRLRRSIENFTLHSMTLQHCRPCGRRRSTRQRCGTARRCA